MTLDALIITFGPLAVVLVGGGCYLLGLWHGVKSICEIVGKAEVKE
jgi:hypothetical protein